MQGFVVCGTYNVLYTIISVIEYPDGTKAEIALRIATDEEGASKVVRDTTYGIIGVSLLHQ